MSRIAYVNGRYSAHSRASVHIDDRAHTFADGVYEVILVVNRHMIDLEDHFRRLDRSLCELDIPRPMTGRVLTHIMNRTIHLNRVVDGIVYLQISRGAAPRNHVFDNASLTPGVVCTARRLDVPATSRDVSGVEVITLPDTRWTRVDIKSVSLLPNVLARTRAAGRGAYEAWLVDGEGFVTECAASNAWIVDSSGRLVTRPVADGILRGITRERLMTLARELSIEVVERPFSVAEAKQAREAFLTSTTSLVKAVSRIDETVVGNGHPGHVTCRLLDAYLDFARHQAGFPDGHSRVVLG